MVFTLADLKRFPAVSRVHFLECSGNFGGRTTSAEITPQQLARPDQQQRVDRRPAGHALPRSRRRVRRRNGFSPKGRTRRCSRAAFPIAKAYDDALIAYGQNGEAIRPEQGYPARLFLPGWEGNASVKWMRRIELSDRPFMTREETSKYTDPMADGTARHLQLPDGRALADHLSRVSGDADAAAGSRSTASRGPDPERSSASTSAPTAARRGRRRSCRSRCCRKRTRGSATCGTGPAATP